MKGSCLAHALEADNTRLSEIEAFKEEVPLEQILGRDLSGLEGALVPCPGPLLAGGELLVQRWLSCGHLVSFEHIRPCPRHFCNRRPKAAHCVCHAAKQN